MQLSGLQAARSPCLSCCVVAAGTLPLSTLCAGHVYHYFHKSEQFTAQRPLAAATDDSDAATLCVQPSEKKVEEHKLVLEGLVQHYKLVAEADKSRTLVELLDHLEFNQVMIFVKSTQRANMLGQLLKDARFPCEVLHGSLKMPERQAIMKKFKESPNEARVLVTTDLASRGIDVERVNVVINYDMPETSDTKGNGVDTYLHRVGRAGRFGTRGIAITFVAQKEETAILNQVQDRFDVGIEALPELEKLDKSAYTNA